jgi:hypothetical protein
MKSRMEIDAATAFPAPWGWGQGWGWFNKDRIRFFCEGA